MFVRVRPWVRRPHPAADASPQAVLQGGHEDKKSALSGRGGAAHTPDAIR